MSDPYEFEPLIDTEEVAKLFKFTPQHIRRLAERRVIPGAKFGREWRFRRSDLVRTFRDACNGLKSVDVFSNFPAAEPPVPPKRPRGRPRDSRKHG